MKLSFGFTQAMRTAVINHEIVVNKQPGTIVRIRQKRIDTGFQEWKDTLSIQC
jgi:hypothetical protein